MGDKKKLLLDLHSKVYELRQSATMALWNAWYREVVQGAELAILRR